MLLIADDDTDFLESLARRLNLRGFCVEAISSAEKTLALVRSHPAKFTLAVVDYGMASGGMPLWRELLAYPIPLYVMTGHGPAFPGEQELLKTPVQGIFHKPIALEKLLNTLKKHGLTPESAG